MKKTQTTLAVSILFVASSLIYSCKKDRIETPEPEQLNAYEPINSYLDSKKQQEQDFVIPGPGNDTIVGNQGTRIYGSKQCLVYPNMDTIDYPFTVHLVELYTPKDMIYWQMPTIASGSILETDGEIRVRATANGQELILKPGCPFGFEMPNGNPDANMTIFTGNDNGSYVNWVDSQTPFTLTAYGYLGYSNTLGWHNADQVAGSGGHTLTFTSSTDDLTNVGIFIYMPATQTVMQVYNKVSGLIPNGTSVKIVLMAQDANGQLFSYTESRTVNSSATIDLSLSQTTDAALTSYLNGL
ncbi:MAG: hypothetical protein KDD41_01260 [Flavobacteriales bacterium]|nr:hypothetical protein [Flavobacteriales bacterium]